MFLFCEKRNTSVAQAAEIRDRSGSAMTSPMVHSAMAQGPEYAQLHSSFSHTSWSMSSNRRTRKPAPAHTLSTFLSRSVIGPPNSPRRTSSMPLWCAWPGARIEAPKPPTTPTITLSLPRTDAAVSGPPNPFWIDSTGVSLLSKGLIDCAAGATCMAFVASTTRSHCPASAAFVVALTLTVRSPEAPSRRRPLARMASTCSRQRSIAHTSWPAEANRPAYTEPMAPVPTIAIFMNQGQTTIHPPQTNPPLARSLPPLSGGRREQETWSVPDLSRDFEQACSPHAAADAHGDQHQLRATALALDERVAGEARAAHA